LFELLTGRVPFQADTITQLCAMILQQQAEPLRNHRPDAPEGLQMVIARCLEKDRNRRYANVAELANALAPFAPRRARLSIERVSRVVQAAGMATSPHPDEGLPSSHGVPASTAASWTATGSAKKGAGLRIALVLGGLVLAGGAAAAVALSKGGSSPEPAATAPPQSKPELQAAAATPAPAPPPTEVTPSVPTPAAKDTASAAPVLSAPSVKAPSVQKKTAQTASTAKAKTPAAAPVPPVAPTPASTPKAPAKKSDLYGDRK
jgi:serine/threonine-protein kinase